MERSGTVKGTAFRRFSAIRVAEHWAVLVAVLVLVVTGLSQRYHGWHVSQWIIINMGGVDMVRAIHRTAGAVFSLITVTHIGAAFSGLALGRWQPTMLICRKDLSDAVHNIRYYAGLEREPARCHRYTYKQKFEYWGLLTGALIMMSTGLVLWMPMVVTRFLPGEAIPVAKALHTNEALLIFLLLGLWHVYNAIFSPEVFPLDRSIFTGYISRERLLREHPLEFENLETFVPDTEAAADKEA